MSTIKAEGARFVDEDIIRDAPEFRDGDFELLSSDNVRFRVQSCYLMAASKVFRDMYSVNDTKQPLKVAFTDSEIEKASVLSLFFHIIINGIVCNTDNDFQDLRELASFLHKWGCAQARQQVIYALESAALQQRGRSLRLFVVAVALQAPSLCVLIVRSRAKETWPSPMTVYPAHKESGVPGMNIWCPQGWPEWFWSGGVPHSYMFALARASGMDGELAVNFERCLRGLISDKHW